MKQEQKLTAYDQRGNRYSLSPTTSRGGEGTLYLDDNHPSLCAKIYNPNRRTYDRYLKILSWVEMRRNGIISADFAEQITVPGDCLFCEADRQDPTTFLGYTMDLLKEFYSPVELARLAGVDYLEKITAAKNIAITTNLVHKNKLIIGDFNNNNIAVFRGGSLRLIDTDSMQFTIRLKGQRRLLACPGLLPEYRPPELRNVDLRGPQTPEHPFLNRYSDYWQMTLHIFRLLMAAASPFASAAQNPEANAEPEMEGALQSFIYAEPTPGRIPPPYAPDYSMLTPELQDLFRACFVAGRSCPEKRPGPAAFYSALCNYEATLKRNPCGHIMPAGRHSCEWCRLEREGYIQ